MSSGTGSASWPLPRPVLLWIGHMRAAMSPDRSLPATDPRAATPAPQSSGPRHAAPTRVPCTRRSSATFGGGSLSTSAC
eukprot:10916166-Alexandrium_andersonii.AAC.1